LPIPWNGSKKDDKDVHISKKEVVDGETRFDLHGRHQREKRKQRAFPRGGGREAEIEGIQGGRRNDSKRREQQLFEAPLKRSYQANEVGRRRSRDI